jgi:glucosamine kinase
MTAMAPRVLGVDGGQSAIRLRVSGDPRIVEVPGVSRAEGDIVAAVGAAVATGWRQGAFQRVDRAVLGLTTAPGDAATAARLGALVGDAIDTAEVWVTDDAVTAHAGALSLGWGVSLAVGTGVACLSVRADGRPRIIGGHGFLLGDEGGAFWLGARGLGAVLRAHEGRGAPTALHEAAVRRYGSLDDLHVRLHDDPRPVHEIAAFAPSVLDAAREGDPLAVGIVDGAVDELLGVVGAGARWAAGRGVSGAADATNELVPVALGGRLLDEGTELRCRLDARLTGARLPIAPRNADASPLDGALALGEAGDPRRYGDLIHAWSRVAVA